MRQFNFDTKNAKLQTILKLQKLDKDSHKCFFGKKKKVFAFHACWSNFQRQKQTFEKT